MPFSVEEFFSVFARYNLAIWPAQIVAYLLGALAAGLLLRETRRSAAAITTILAAMWAINAIGYHWMSFAEINPAARLFALVFLLQAALLAAAPWISRDLRFCVRRDARSVAGLALMLFAAVLYPVWGALAGHAWPAAPVFGVAPCPTTIFTVGMLLLGSWRAARWLLIIPGLWSLVGGSAAILLNVPQDFGLIATLVVLIGLTAARAAGARAARHG